VLDDIDYINDQSQQVFRNCIDKYQHNVNFICSCRNIQKVIENIQSRLVIIKIKSLERENIENIFNKIKYNENIPIDQEAKDFILSISNNNVKSLINYMEKCKLINEPITFLLANKICTNINFLIFNEYIETLINKKLIESIRITNALFDKGYSVIDILDSFFSFLKTTSLLTEDQKYNIIPIICKYINIFHMIHEDEIELSLFTMEIMGCL
jgi:DNA polymerase III delta prime subunit